MVYNDDADTKNFQKLRQGLQSLSIQWQNAKNNEAVVRYIGARFSVEADLDTNVVQLRHSIAATSRVDAPLDQLTLYWVRDVYLSRNKFHVGWDHFLREAIDCGAVEEMPDSATVGSFGPNFAPRHVLVALESLGVGVKAEVPTARPQENIGLKELWRYSGLISTQPPPDGTLSKVLQRRLPFRVRIRDEQIAGAIFAKNGPELRCDDLSSLIDVLIMSREAYERGDATRHPSRGSNDQFFGFTEQICQANGFRLKLQWTDSNEAGDNGSDDKKPTRQPGLVVYCNDCVVLCGQEVAENVNVLRAEVELADKVKSLNPMFCGKLQYMLGYVSEGKYQAAFMVGQHDLIFPLRGDSLADAIKFFYNLAFVFGAMAVWSKVTRPTQLSPFKINENEHGTIELRKQTTQITIKRSKCRDGREFKRLVSIYKTLEMLNSTEMNGLQHVTKLEQTRFGSRKIVVDLSPVGFYRLPEDTAQVYTWLRNILAALAQWHGSGYCHGRICWENMVNTSMFPSWTLVNMETSRKSSMLIVTDRYGCHHDLVQLGRLMDELHKTKFALTDKLLWIRDKLLSARIESQAVTAEKVLVMLRRLQKSPAENLHEVVSAVLAACATPETTPEFVLEMLRDFMPLSCAL